MKELSRKEKISIIGIVSLTGIVVLKETFKCVRTCQYDRTEIRKVQMITDSLNFYESQKTERHNNTLQTISNVAGTLNPFNRLF